MKIYSHSNTCQKVYLWPHCNELEFSLLVKGINAKAYMLHILCISLECMDKFGCQAANLKTFNLF